MKLNLILGAAAALLITACETTSSRPYVPSTRNVIEIQNKTRDTEVKVKVGEFSAAEGVNLEPTCRALGALEVAPGKLPIKFIRDAFEEELFLAQIYDSTSDVEIVGRLDELEPNSLGRGWWKIALNVSSNKLPDGYTVSTKYEFKSSYSAVSACQNVIDAFTPAVNELLGKVVADPQFDALIGKI